MNILRAFLSSRVTVMVVFLLLLYAGPKFKPNQWGFVRIGNADFKKAYFPAGHQLRQTGTFRYTYAGIKNLPIVAWLCVPFAPDVQNDSRQFHKAKELGGRWFAYMQLACHATAFVLCLLFFAKTASARWALVLFFIGLRPYYISLGLGQFTGLCLVFIIAALVLYTCRRMAWVGLFVTLAFVLKIPAGVLWLYFLWKRQWSTVVTSMICYLAIVGLSFFLFGIQLHRDYYQFAIKANVGKTLTALNNASTHAAVTRFTMPDDEPPKKQLRNWSMVKVPPPANWTILAGIVLTFVLLARLMGTNVPEDEIDKRLEFSMAICVLLMIFPVVWDHYHLFLVIPLLTCYEVMRRRNRTRWHDAVVLLAAFCLINLPVSLILKKIWLDPKNTEWCRLVTMAPLFASVLLLYLTVSQTRGRRKEALRREPTA